MASTALGLAAMMACSGDTLYDDDGTDGVDGPAVRIIDPTGGQAQTGRPVRILVGADDPLGVAQIEIAYRGVATGTITRTYSPPRVDVVLDTVLQLPAGEVGELEITAIARNGFDATGTSETVTLEVTPGDQVAPAVAVTTVTPERMELDDEVQVRISARDNAGGGGIARVGLTVLITSSERADTVILERNATFEPPRGDLVTVDFSFTPPGVTADDVPRDLTLEYFAFAVDSAGNCAAGTGADFATLPCAPLREGQPEPIVAGAPGAVGNTLVVAGTSVDLPSSTVVPDAAVDFPRQRLYLSSLSRSRIEVLNLGTRTFGAPVLVGSEPWGVALNRTSDTLIVANSGGTNLSYVPLAGALNEDVSKRVRTPNSNIFVVARTVEAELERLAVTFFDFSDRPQFIAQDFQGRLIYSTKPTPAAPDGTVRIAERQQGWVQTEVKLLFTDLITNEDSTTFSFAHLDSMRVFVAPGASDRIEFYDHVPGFPTQIIRSGILPFFDAIAEIQDLGSDMVWAPGTFDQELVGLRDTTYVAASGDRRRIAIGEGSVNPGRVIMWHAPLSTISNEITIADLIGNASEQITGIALNEDGTLNALRGTMGAYFFKEDLRLQGLSSTDPAQAGSGAQLHPQHPSYTGFPGSGANTVAFVAAGDVVRIVDTVHFIARGEIAVRDRITGPLRVSPPLGGGGACPGPDCVVATLYGVTNAGTVVIVNVRSRDIS